MSVGALSFFGSEGYDVRRTREGICAQSDLLQYMYIVKHYAGGVNSEFSNFGLFQKQMGILVSKLSNWVSPYPCKSPNWFYQLRKNVISGDINKPSNHVSMLLAPADIVYESSLYNTILQQLYTNNYI